MIAKHMGGYAVECDICGQETFYQIPEGPEAFAILLNEMRHAGWENRKIADEWENYCRDCINMEKDDE